MVKNEMQNTRMMDYVALDSNVLIVAVEGAVQDWAAYIGAVEGEDFDKEYLEVARNGTKVPKEIAEFYFPKFKHLKWRE